MSFNQAEDIYVRLKPRSKEQPHGKLAIGRLGRTYVAGAWTVEKPSAGRAQLVAYLRELRPHEGAYRDLQEPIFEIKSAEAYKDLQESEIRRRNAAAQGIVLKDGGFVKPKAPVLPDPSLLAPVSVAPSEPSEVKVASPVAPSLEDLGIDGGEGEGSEEGADPEEDDSQGNLFTAPKTEDPAPQTSKPSGKKSK